MPSAASCEEGNGDDDGEQEIARAVKPLAPAQPEIQSDAAMRPDERQQDELLGQSGRGIGDPDAIEDAIIAIVEIIERGAAARVDDMRDKKQRNEKPEAQLPCFERRRLEMATPVEGAQPERGMDENRAEKRGAADQRLPRRQDHIAADRIHSRKAEHAGRVTQKMTGRVGK
jgi:hypothetical protein